MSFPYELTVTCSEQIVVLPEFTVPFIKKLGIPEKATKIFLELQMSALGVKIHCNK